MDTKYIVYALFNIASPSIVRYVGLTTKTAEHRLRGHWKNARRGVKSPTYFWMRKYGPENIGVRVLGTYETREEMIAGEIYWIAHFRSIGQADLNITDGGEGVTGWRMTDEQKEARRQYMLTNPIQYEITPEHRKAVGDSNRRRLSTLEAKAEHANKVGKLRATEVEAIKRDIWDGMSDKDAAEKYGTSFQNVNNIRLGKSWGFVPWPIGPWQKTRIPDMPKGEEVHNAKLKAEDVVTIRRLVRGASYGEVAEMYGVSAATVNNIARGKVWKSVPFEDEYPPITDDRDLSIQRRAVSGENSKTSRLNEEQVRYIRREVVAGRTYAELGREIGVSEVTVADVAKRKTWKHIK